MGLWKFKNRDEAHDEQNTPSFGLNATVLYIRITARGCQRSIAGDISSMLWRYCYNHMWDKQRNGIHMISRTIQLLLCGQKLVTWKYGDDVVLQDSRRFVCYIRWSDHTHTQTHTRRVKKKYPQNTQFTVHTICRCIKTTKMRQGWLWVKSHVEKCYHVTYDGARFQPRNIEKRPEERRCTVNTHRTYNTTKWLPWSYGWVGNWMLCR